MCGICGFVSKRETDFDRQEILKSMLSKITHRGPDDEGLYFDDQCAFGMRRLSIIDLKTGHQPIASEDGSLLLICNGEIYNHQTLRRELEAKGHRFKTGSDVETILHLYEEDGENAVSRLEGMFSFALWDSRRKKLFTARDHAGIKPLFYYQKGDLFAFASEIKSLLSIPQISRRLDKEALYNYFSLNYIPSPLSIYSHIKKLEPASIMTWREGETKTYSYWDLKPHQIKDSLKESQWTEMVYNGLEQSVKKHLISDVPIGVFLSGGVDSTACAAFMSRLGVKVRSYSIGFEEKSFNELKHAQKAADHYGFTHRDLVVKPDAVSLLPQIARFFDEPFADSSALPVYYVSKLAAEEVKAVLSGEGGDELFAGYMTYEADMLAESYRRLPAPITKQIVPAIASILPSSTKKVSFDYKLKRFAKGALYDLAKRHYMWKVIFTEEDKGQLFNQDFINDTPFSDTAELFQICYNKYNPKIDPLNHLLYVDTKIYLPDDLLVKVDRMSMAHSLETRLPFLDKALMELAFSIPSSLKLKGRQKKYILKQALKGLVPDRILHRKKEGFSMPAAKWLREDLKEMGNDLLSKENVKKTGILNPDFIRQVWCNHQEGKADNSRQIWSILMFLLWHENEI